LKVKQILSLILCLLLILPMIVGCSTTGSKETTAATEAAPLEHSLSVGFGRADVTPSAPVPLSGLFSARLSSGVNQPLYVNCIVFTDETGNSFMIISADFLYPYTPMMFAKSDICKATGIPFNQIWIATTHNHSGPNLNDEHANIEPYSKFLREEIVKAAQAAMEDRKPAKMYITDARPEKINFIRHYITANGTYAGDNFGTVSKDNPIVDYESKPDNQLQLVKFTREGAKDIILMNWQGHPTGHSGKDLDKIMSCVTVAIDKLERDLGCHAAYILGASGNVNNQTRISADRISSYYVEHFEKLAQYGVDAAKNFTPVETDSIQVLDQACVCDTKGGGQKEVPLNAFVIGDVAFVAAPYEMFSANGQFVKENSPYKMTFVSTCTNGYDSYIPYAPTYEYGGYEANGCSYVKGTAEKLADTFVAMLKQLHETK